MQVIQLLENVYTNAYNNHPESYGAKLVAAIKDYKYSNGMPLNILKAVTIYNAVNDLVSVNQATNEDLRCLLNRLVIKTGYSREELLERVAI